MKLFKTFTILGVLASAGAAFGAENSHYLKVTVPFAFVVAGQQFTPGEYSVSQTETGIITVQGRGKAAAVLSTPFEASKYGETSGLHFTNNESREYLTGVSVEGEGTRAVPVHLSQRTLTLASK